MLFNDIVIYTKTWKTHLDHARMALFVLNNHQLLVKKEKCRFNMKQVTYLRYFIYEKGVKADPNKITAINHWPKQTNIRELRVFFGIDWLL